MSGYVWSRFAPVSPQLSLFFLWIRWRLPHLRNASALVTRRRLLSRGLLIWSFQPPKRPNKKPPAHVSGYVWLCLVMSAQVSPRAAPAAPFRGGCATDCLAVPGDAARGGGLLFGIFKG